jgi:hypothetical protein
MHRFTKEHLDFLRGNITEHSYAEMTDLFNEHFKAQLSFNQINAALHNHKIRNGNNTQFKRGQTSWNKGKKGLNTGGYKGHFKKGNIPYNYRPVGSESVDRDGYTWVKTADKIITTMIEISKDYIYITEKITQQNQRRMKHQLIWEAANGPIPDGHVVIFGDRNRQNFDPDNLILVSNAQLARLNQNGLIYNNAELTRTGLIIADIITKNAERKRR